MIQRHELTDTFCSNLKSYIIKWFTFLVASEPWFLQSRICDTYFFFFLKADPGQSILKFASFKMYQYIPKTKLISGVSQPFSSRVLTQYSLGKFLMNVTVGQRWSFKRAERLITVARLIIDKVIFTSCALTLCTSLSWI